MKMTAMSELNCSNESGRMNNVRLTALFQQAENTKLCKIQIELILTRHHTFQTNFYYLSQRLNKAYFVV